MKQEYQTLQQLLDAYVKTGIQAMHMPGHKRNCNFAPYLKELSAQYDITEVDIFDQLHEAQGVLKKSMERATKLWGAKNSFYLVNGSTCGILAAVRAATKSGDRVLIARGCHRSVYHALEICNLFPYFLEPLQENQMYMSLTAQQVEEALIQYQDVKLIILTSPTYEGVISPVAGICRVAKKYGVQVLVDEAHGAHLDLFDVFQGGAVRAGADFVVQSFHKTLPSLTQTAILHHNSEKISHRELARQLSIFETSSPSYLLLSSMDSCVDFLYQNGKASFLAWKKNLEEFDNVISHLQHLRVLCHGRDVLKNHQNIWGFDAGKILIDTAYSTLDAQELAKRLKENHKIEVEMVHGRYVLAMTSVCDTKEQILHLAQALCEIDASCSGASVQEYNKKRNSCSQQVMTITQACSTPSICIPFSASCGKISAEYVWAYPPGAPILIPGERIFQEKVNEISQLLLDGTKIFSTHQKMPDRLYVLKGNTVDEP